MDEKNKKMPCLRKTTRTKITIRTLIYHAMKPIIIEWSDLRENNTVDNKKKRRKQTKIIIKEKKNDKMRERMGRTQKNV